MHVVWCRWFGAATDTEVLGLFHTKFALQLISGVAYNVEGLKLLTHKMLYKFPHSVADYCNYISLVRKRGKYSFFYSQMGQVLFLQKKKKKNFKSLLTCAKMQLGKLL